MKLLGATALLMTAVSANDKWAKLGDLWQGVAQNGNLDDDDRKVIELFTISSVANYGCWCRFNNYRPYKGPTMDTVDAACKQWYQNYDCLHFDYSNTNDYAGRCDLTVEYNDTLTTLNQPFSPTTDYMAECATANPGSDCAATACAVDAVFIREVFVFLADNTLNMTLSGWYGFDGTMCGVNSRNQDGTTAAPGALPTTLAPPVVPTTAAPGTTAVPEPTVSCCGAYPNRFQFKLMNGNRQCCVDSVFNPNLHECCANGSTADIGNC